MDDFVPSGGVYALCCPITHIPRYIGRSGYLVGRFKSHRSITNTKTPVSKWVYKLRQHGLHPIEKVLFYSNSDPELYKNEKMFISLYKGHLLNKMYPAKQKEKEINKNTIMYSESLDESNPLKEIIA